MTRWNELLEKYDEPYVPGEAHTNEYHQRILWESKLKNRMLLVDQLCLEAKYFIITDSEKQRVKYLIRIFNEDFKSLHRRVSDETIILAFIIFLKKLETPKLQLKDYSITKKYGLTDTVFEIILCRLLEEFMTNSPIYLTETLRDVHEDNMKGDIV